MIEELRHIYPLNILFRILAISKSSYYYTRKAVNKENKDITIKSCIKTIYHKNKRRYGYRRITLELKNQRIFVNHKRVKRLMKQCFTLWGILLNNNGNIKITRMDHLNFTNYSTALEVYKIT